MLDKPDIKVGDWVQWLHPDEIEDCRSIDIVTGVDADFIYINGSTESGLLREWISAVRPLTAALAQPDAGEGKPSDLVKLTANTMMVEIGSRIPEAAIPEMRAYVLRKLTALVEWAKLADTPPALIVEEWADLEDVCRLRASSTSDEEEVDLMTELAAKCRAHAERST